MADERAGAEHTTLAGDRQAPDPALSFRQDGRAAVDWAADYIERVRDLPVLAQVEPGWLRAQLPEVPPEHGEPFADLLRDMDELILPATTHWNHPRFFAYFPNSGAEPGILAELLIATLNTNGMLWRTNPASTELELHVMDWVMQLLGLPRTWFGHIEDTASTSTLAALAAAREVGGGRRVVLCSDQAHSSVDKACRMLELELRKVASDAEFRMRVDALEAELAKGDACAVVATVGTTSTTSVDPVPAIADLCEQHGAWLHVDGAFAGAAGVCPEFRWLLEGVERADSFVVNPHKWLFTPIDCSLLFTSRPDDLRRAFSLVPEYLRTDDGDAVNLMEYGPALGRRMRALKLWAVLRCYGREGIQTRIREAVRLTERFEQHVRADDRFEIVAPRPLSCLCFRLKGSDADNDALPERVNATGVCFISNTTLNGQRVLRFAVGNMRTTEADIDLSWETIRAAV